ncbi:unnamed protein product [marine sediment metagenome]|uniref:Uncharacterized protein n=1 Tax=marine sediment metagenome TaxID=412755 RepID=X1KM41_9ZZZZ
MQIIDMMDLAISWLNPKFNPESSSGRNPKQSLNSKPQCSKQLTSMTFFCIEFCIWLICPALFKKVLGSALDLEFV